MLKRNVNGSRLALLAACVVTLAALGGCQVQSSGDTAPPAAIATKTPQPPPVQGSAACRQIQAMNLPSADHAVDAANDFGATPPNGAIRLTRAQMAGLRAYGNTLLALTFPDPEFARNAREAGRLLVTIGNSLDGYTDNDQAPAMDRYERYLQSACGLRS